MKNERISRIIKSKLVVVTAAILLVFALGLKLLPSFIDVAPYNDTLKKMVKEATGRDLIIRASRVDFSPFPEVIFEGIKISGEEGQPEFTANALRLEIAPLTFFSAQPVYEKISLIDPALNVSRNAAGQTQWGWLNASLYEKIFAAGDKGVTNFVLQGGRYVIAGDAVDAATGVSNINLQGALGGNTQLAGSFALAKRVFNITLGKQGDNATLDIRSPDDDQFALKTQIIENTDGLALKGTAELKFASITPYLTPEKPSSTTQTPLAISADFTQSGAAILLSNIVLEGLNSKASGSAEYRYDEKDNVTLSLVFDSMDYVKWRDAFLVAFATNDSANLSAGNEAAKLTNPFPDKANIALDIVAKSLIFGEQTWKEASLRATLADHIATINTLNLQLPGDSSLGLFGVITLPDDKGFRFQGNAEAKGASLRQLLTVFDESAIHLPEMGFGGFSIRSNISLSRDLLRLSEASATFSELNLKGGMVAYFEEKPRIVADVNLKDINFDYFRDAWRQQSKQNPTADYFVKFNKETNFDWLKKLGASVDFKVAVDGFQLLERKGSAASFRLFAQAGEMGLYNGRFGYANDVTEANIKLDVKGETPNLNVVFNASEINGNYFTLVPQTQPHIAEPLALPLPQDMPALPAAPVPSSVQTVIETKPQSEIFPALSPATPAEKPSAVPTPRWSEALIDMGWMDGVSGNFDISIGKLQHQGRIFNSFKLLAKLERNLVTFQTLTFAYLNSSFSINGTLFGGKVPGVALGFVMASSDLKDILSEALAVHNISGRVSLSGTVETSGVNALSWVSQSQAKILFSGRGVSVNGFDIPAAIEAVRVSRTAEDVFNNVNRVLVVGTGEYELDGTVNVENGVLRSPGITMNSGNAAGTLSGEMRLIPWDLKLQALFQFPELTSDTIPTLNVEWEGDINHPQIKTDTQALEAYVSKRITGN